MTAASLPIPSARSPRMANTPANSTNTVPTVLLCRHCGAPIRAAASRFTPPYLHTETNRTCCVDGELGTAEPANTLTLGSIA